MKSTELDFKVGDLRCGNIVNYQTAEGDILPATIDWQDLKWLTEDSKGFNLVHSPMKLTEAKLEEFKITKAPFTVSNCVVYVFGKWQIRYNKETNAFNLGHENTAPQALRLVDFEFVHELQNLYKCLVGRELGIKKKLQIELFE